MIGSMNPFRYRGYYYDTETGFYYLNSRYYDPEICRFINADHVNYLGANGDLNSFNLYAYCGNNPVIYIDLCIYYSQKQGFSINVSSDLMEKISELLYDYFKAKKEAAIRYNFAYNGKTYSATYNESEQCWTIIDSFEISDKKVMYLECYNLIAKNPVPTEPGGTTYRTLDDMVYEWEQHNVAYNYFIKIYNSGIPFSSELYNYIAEGISRAKNVSINPGDQGKNWIELCLDRILK